MKKDICVIYNVTGSQITALLLVTKNGKMSCLNSQFLYQKTVFIRLM